MTIFGASEAIKQTPGVSVASWTKYNKKIHKIEESSQNGKTEANGAIP